MDRMGKEKPNHGIFPRRGIFQKSLEYEQLKFTGKANNIVIAFLTETYWNIPFGGRSPKIPTMNLTALLRARGRTAWATSSTRIKSRTGK